MENSVPPGDAAGSQRRAFPGLLIFLIGTAFFAPSLRAQPCDPPVVCTPPPNCIYQGGDTCQCGTLVCTPPPPPPPPVVSQPPGAASFSGVTATQVQANWTDGGNPAGTIYTAALSALPASSPVQTLSTTNLFQAFSNLSPNTAYSAEVQATAPGAPASAFTSLGSIVTLANAPAALPASAVQATQLTANWGANGNPPGTSYLAQISTDPAFTVILNSQSTTAMAATFVTLTPNTAYYTRVAASNGAGVLSAFTSLPTVTTPAALLNAPALSATALTPSAIQWSWTSVAAATIYRVLDANGTNISGDLAASVTNFTEQNLQPNTAYKRSVAAISGGLGAVSAPLTRYTLANPPSGTQVSNIGVSSMTVTWSSAGNPANTSYVIDARATGGGTLSLTKTGTRALVTSLQAGTTYFVQVTALNGDSVRSAPGTAASTGGNTIEVLTLGVASAPSLSRANIYPNPFRPAHGDTQVTFGNLPLDARIRIYTLVGERVRDLSAGGNTNVIWDVTNDTGHAVASGVYFVLLQSGGDKKILKLAVQR